LRRSIVVRAPRPVVFRYFTDSERFAAWWGAGSRIDARPGGEMRICYPNAVVAFGNVESIVPDERIVFTYGYEDSTKPFHMGISRVTISLADDADGTRLELLHEFASPEVRDAHVAGWRYQLSVFANVVSREVNATVVALIDGYFAIWNERDPFVRRKRLAEIADERIEFHDDFAAIRGAGDFDEHVAAVHLHMPGSVLERHSEPRHCQGHVLVDWIVRRNGAPAGAGTNYFDIDAFGRIRRVVGFRSR
jgi:uncharacterized protein YndB with AHSA1/START domain